LTPTGTGYQDGTNNFGDNTYFLTELNNSGSILQWNTYFGDTEDGVIAKFSPSHALLWFTFFGGNGSFEHISSIKIHGGDLYITGETSTTSTSTACAGNTSGAFPLCNGGYDAEVDPHLLLYTNLLYVTGTIGTTTGQVQANWFQLFPNPTSSQLTIQLANNIEDGSTFVIYNSIGLIVFSLDLFTIGQNRIFSIDIAFLATGMYAARLEKPSASSVERFIKE
jgi:hypothetical protein